MEWYVCDLQCTLNNWLWYPTGAALNYASVFIWKVHVSRPTVSFHKNTPLVSIKVVIKNKIGLEIWNSLTFCVKHLNLAIPFSIQNVLVFREIDKSNAFWRCMWNDPNVIYEVEFRAILWSQEMLTVSGVTFTCKSPQRAKNNINSPIASFCIA